LSIPSPVNTSSAQLKCIRVNDTWQKTHSTVTDAEVDLIVECTTHVIV
jgi:hypothetical protein